jgi:hypothetical protein
MWPLLALREVLRINPAQVEEISFLRQVQRDHLRVRQEVPPINPALAVEIKTSILKLHLQLGFLAEVLRVNPAQAADKKECSPFLSSLPGRIRFLPGSLGT